MLQVVIIRHSLFTLAERDVMEASFPVVALATVGVLGFLVGVVVGLMLTGTGEVSEEFPRSAESRYE